MKLLSDLISLFDLSNPHFRPTELYNESWLMKTVAHQASTIPDPAFPHSVFFPEAPGSQRYFFPLPSMHAFRVIHVARRGRAPMEFLGIYEFGQEPKRISS
ncbi:MAG: hypothetical protein KAJ55_04225 [Anaerolineales bacterium]|nr:hypothetical protein [Anaerolineales bacterium]